ncbi:unannotated protein [freshwater metagenome]|uniref:Unannotated protein n=1 Tax=freshwater metagenome TaxID=449393 RepID=A0A6J7W7U7_9ZZZZ|nr:tyrosine recombinase [Actinomycetota bacterium]MSW62525.1 tyrosine recombinase [Actinomycetota bacterium]MSX89474.1 tyrosine recombinase [Actinomycetota bacterium]MSZ64171.1 tyrosine recombinase [Actinomycetota bacterium]MTA57867.1 tyrosine recombinase [Actinomycetota bacterium]
MVTSTHSFDALAQSFLNYCAIERGLASNSIAAYRRDLAKFAVFLGSMPVEEIDSQFITEFEVSLRDAQLSTSSINRVESTLRTFFRYGQLEYGLVDPTLEIVAGKSHRRLPKALTVDEIGSLIDASFHEGNLITIRDRAIIELLYGSGARVSELIGIDLTDLNLVESQDGPITVLKLRGKGSKERIVPLGSYAMKAIDDYKVRLRPSLASKAATHSASLFLNSRGGRLTRQSAWTIVLNAAEAAGLAGKVSPHVFRHSYATHLLDGGADIRVVQELLGHASVTTTQIYTLITIDKVRESYSMAHPRA